VGGKHGTLAERFETKVDRLPGYGPHGSCHLWTACTSGKGYGRICEGVGSSKNLRAHRVAWELANGPIPDGLHVLHHCDNSRCVNVEHLFLGTNADNVADRDGKGRQARGSDVHPSKLTEADIPRIRQLLVDGLTQAEVGRRYGVTHSQISRINTGHTWGHV
jgi:hypothetical protein